MPDPSLPLGWRGGEGERGEQQAQAGSCHEHLNADMSGTGKLYDRQFSCDLDPESLRRSETFFFNKLMY